MNENSIFHYAQIEADAALNDCQSDIKNGLSEAEASKRLKDLGAIVDNVSLPHTRYGVAAYYIIAPAEASANLATGLLLTEDEG